MRGLHSQSAALASSRALVLGRGKAAGVIVRVLRAKVRAERVGAFNAVLRRQVALLREQPGLSYVNLARRLKPDGGQDAILFEEWRDADALYAWAGPKLSEPRLVPGARELMDEVVVAHYECLIDEDTTGEPSARTDAAVKTTRGRQAAAKEPREGKAAAKTTATPA
jgi:quinol monooxygenase YgiN